MFWTRDETYSLVRKLHTTFEAPHMDAKTMGGYVVCLFVIASLERRPGQVPMNCYA